MEEGERVIGRVMDVEYDDSDELVVYMVVRTRSGRRKVCKVYGTTPFLFVHEDAQDPRKNKYLAEFVKSIESGYESYDGHDLIRVNTITPADVRKVRSKYDTTWEADLPFVRRCTSDYGMSGYVSIPNEESFHVSEIESVDRTEVESIDPRVCMYDIEVKVPDQFYDGFAEDADNPVTAIAAYDSYDDEYTLFALDPELQIDPGKIRHYIEENWAGHEDYDRVTDIDIVFKRFGDESSLLQSFADYVGNKQFDVMTGWNAVDFDHEYIVNRMHQLADVNPHTMSDIGTVGGRRTETYIQGVPAIDMMKAFCGKLSYGEWQSQSLEYVSNQVLGAGKVEGDDVNYNANRTKFMAYNIVDTQLCAELDRQRGIMQFWYQLAEVTAIPPYDVGTTMKECEGYLFKHRDDDEILPSTEEEDMEGISGGLVLPAYEGLEDWVGVFDLKSLYPSSIITCNISKETMTTDPEEADVIVPDMPLNYEKVMGNKITSDDIGWEIGEGACMGFNLDEQGILPKYLTKLFDERDQLKSLRNQNDPDSAVYERYDQQQRAVKVVMNSFFGVSDHPYFRLSAEGLGAAITSVSRFVSWGGVQVIEDQGYDVLYGDTDSLMVQMTDNEDADVEAVVDEMESLETDINSGLSFVAEQIGLPQKHPFFPEDFHGNDQHAWVYEAEKLYRRFLQAGTKKRYAGNIVWKEGKYVQDVDVSGLEVEKADATDVTKHVQEKLLEKALDGEEFKHLSEFIREEIEKVKAANYSVQEIGFPSSISKPIEEYPNMPVKRAAKYSNNHLGYDWQADRDPWLIYVDETRPGLPNTDVIALEWTDDSLPEGFTINADKHVDKAIKNPVESLIDAFDFTWEELKTGKREQSFLGEAAQSDDDEPMFANNDNETEDPFKHLKDD